MLKKFSNIGKEMKPRAGGAFCVGGIRHQYCDINLIIKKTIFVPKWTCFIFEFAVVDDATPIEGITR